MGADVIHPITNNQHTADLQSRISGISPPTSHSTLTVLMRMLGTKNVFKKMKAWTWTGGQKALMGWSQYAINEKAMVLRWHLSSPCTLKIRNRRGTDMSTFMHTGNRQNRCCVLMSFPKKSNNETQRLKTSQNSSKPTHYPGRTCMRKCVFSCLRIKMDKRVSKSTTSWKIREVGKHLNLSLCFLMFQMHMWVDIVPGYRQQWASGDAFTNKPCEQVLWHFYGQLINSPLKMRQICSWTWNTFVITQWLLIKCKFQVCASLIGCYEVFIKSITVVTFTYLWAQME